MTKDEQSAAFRAIWKKVISPAFDFVNGVIDVSEPRAPLLKRDGSR
jgi:hypothetical protein